MKKLMILSLFFFAAACSSQSAPQSASKKNPDCKCTHTECPCPKNCDKCYCQNQ